MPELPDITAYLSALTPRVVDQPLERLRIASPLCFGTGGLRPSIVTALQSPTSVRRLGGSTTILAAK